jgi:cephalosporin-C deacetylase-like acetyl esterase
MKYLLPAMVLLLVSTSAAPADEPQDGPSAVQMLAEYFRSETRQLAENCLADIHTWEDWTGRRDEYRGQLLEMLGLDPLPERTPLDPVVTGVLEHEEFTVEKLHFQSRPRLYVTGNLYLPKGRTGPCPAVLYLCGHAPVVKDGISYGNKTYYQTHGAWFARNGFVCLVLDTLQLGEIEGIHHGTYRENMWWWNARGYTPAGVEAWNAIRALDYLQSRPEVDGERLGVTGRSGGGASSWWTATLDERIKAAVPVAGITNLEDHVVEGCVEGHCDCMYPVNTYRWDFGQLAALVAPRPLVLANTDHDTIFPLDGVMDTYRHLRRIYDLAGAPERLGLHISAGPHDDTQVLKLDAFAWFNHHLKGDDAALDPRAPAYFEPEQLKVFAELPSDEVNTRIHESFTPAAPAPAVPEDHDAWEKMRSDWLVALREKVFRGWPSIEGPPKMQRLGERRLGEVVAAAYEFESQPHVPLRLFTFTPADFRDQPTKLVTLRLLDEPGWREFVATAPAEVRELLGVEPAASDEEAERAGGVSDLLTNSGATVYMAPRGIGPSAWSPQSPNSPTHIRRRFMLLGQTLDVMRVWDARRAIQCVRTLDGFADAHVRIEAQGDAAGLALYAALFEPTVSELELRGLARSHRNGPDFLNVLRFLDIPQAVAMAAENATVRIEHDQAEAWEYPLAVAARLEWHGRVQIEKRPAEGASHDGASK